MKKLVLFAIMAVSLFSVQAQLGTPKITVRDTFFIVGCFYNGSELNVADWPDAIIIEDALSVTIAGYTYKKGAPTYTEIHEYNSSWEGHVDYYEFKATCNGKKEDMVKVIAGNDCERKFYGDIPYYGKYIIGDYIFNVVTKDDMLKFMNQYQTFGE